MDMADSWHSVRCAGKDGLATRATGLGHGDGSNPIGCLGLLIDQAAQRLQRSILRVAPGDQIAR